MSRCVEPTGSRRIRGGGDDDDVDGVWRPRVVLSEATPSLDAGPLDGLGQSPLGRDAHAGLFEGGVQGVVLGTADHGGLDVRVVAPDDVGVDFALGPVRVGVFLVEVGDRQELEGVVAPNKAQLWRAVLCHLEDDVDAPLLLDREAVLPSLREGGVHLEVVLFVDAARACNCLLYTSDAADE